MLIRRYKEKDFQQVWNLLVKSSKSSGIYKGNGPWYDDLRNIEKHYLLNEGEFLVGEYGGRIIAMGAYRKGEDGIAEVKRIRIHPQFQGHGYGKKILDELENLAKSNGYQGFILETTEVQIPAQKLYLKTGFKEVSREPADGLNRIWFKKIFSRNLEPAAISGSKALL